MPDRILPSFLVLLKVWKLGGDIRIDFAESRPLVLAVLYRHGDQGNVAEGWFAVRSGGTTVGAVGRAGRDVCHSIIGSGCGGRGGCRWCGGIAIGRTMKGAHGRRTLVIQVMVCRASGGDGGGRVHEGHGVGAVQTVMGMMVVMMVVAQGDMMRR